jgi:hypothetical protein
VDEVMIDDEVHDALMVIVEIKRMWRGNNMSEAWKRLSELEATLGRTLRKEEKDAVSN